MSFEKAFKQVIIKEGRYSNNPMDSGGKTNYGITIAVARENGYTGDMRELTLDIAKDIYRKCYWDISQLDDIANISPKIADKLFDAGVNLGTTRANRFLQRVLNALNSREKLWRDLKVDGRIGNLTIHHLNLASKKVNKELILKAYKCLQGAFYLELVENREKDEVFFKGWLDKRV